MQTTHLWRVKHDYERPGNWKWRLGLPEVYVLDDTQQVQISEPWQRLIVSMNPTLTGRNYRNLLREDRAFTNTTGYSRFPRWHPKYKRRRDYINSIDLRPNLPYPAYDKIRICGGAVVSGVQVGEEVWIATLVPGSVPDLEYLRRNPWFVFRAVNITMDKFGMPLITNFPQAGGAAVWLPLVSPVSIKYPLQFLERVEEPVVF